MILTLLSALAVTARYARVRLPLRVECSKSSINTGLGTAVRLQPPEGHRLHLMPILYVSCHLVISFRSPPGYQPQPRTGSPISKPLKFSDLNSEILALRSIRPNPTKSE